ncbi:MAG TPA: acyltransferase [Chitinophagaceae bacterium]|jgi:peptidoglycan/LPS O-acetylase OafA/YrhL|nr:acyltransferase [Chitinophagaceae bacterium]
MAAASFFQRFRRVSRSTNYLPELDGLRFLAIFMVAFLLHLPNYLNRELYDGRLITHPAVQGFILENGHGMGLFFAISAFILGLPFARGHLGLGRPLPLKEYGLRRLTRIVPPYVVALLLFFVLHVGVLRSYTVEGLAPHLLASLLYVHTLYFGEFSRVLPVAWSLEVEVQFYLLAPLLCLLFRLRSKALRRAILVVVTLGSAAYWHGDWGLPHLLKMLHYFTGGLLITDLYLDPPRKRPLPFWVGLVSLLLFLFLPSLEHRALALVKLGALLLLFYCVLFQPGLKAVFSRPLIVVIGGMCYSIYLLHFGIISGVGHLIRYLGGETGGAAAALLYGLVMAIAVLIGSAVFFLLVEKPFMKWRAGSSRAGRSAHL